MATLPWANSAFSPFRLPGCSLPQKEEKAELAQGAVKFSRARHGFSHSPATGAFFLRSYYYHAVSNKRLIIRLSSLGDVILATSALSLPPASKSDETHWVVAREYSGLLKGHPRLTKVWEFDRSKGGGILAWLSLCEKLWNEGFTEVWIFTRRSDRGGADLFSRARENIEARNSMEDDQQRAVEAHGTFAAEKILA